MTQPLVHLLVQALYLVVCLSAPVLAAVMLVGLGSAILQTTTQVRDPSLSLVPKLIVGLVTLILMAPFITTHLVSFMRSMIALLPAVGKT